MFFFSYVYDLKNGDISFAWIICQIIIIIYF